MLGKLTIRLKEKNKTIYEHIKSRKRKLLQTLIQTQRKLEETSLRTLAIKEMKIKNELEEVLNHEEMLWKQKSRCD